MEGYAGEGPKWRLEHASNDRAVCQQAACKRNQTKIAKGELRIGTHTLFDGNGEHRWYMAWRHWGCGTKHQMAGLKEVSRGDATLAAGYDRLSEEAQEQVRLAFEHDGVADKDFKGIREDLAKFAKRYGGEITNATSYKVDVAKRGTAGCRNSECPAKGVKIAKGQLRLGYLVPFDEDHGSWVYKHWACMSKFDLDTIMERHGEELLDGLDHIPDEYQMVVTETLEKGEVMQPPQPEAEAKANKAPARKSKAGTKKRKNKAEETDDESAPEYVPRKTRRRSWRIT